MTQLITTSAPITPLSPTLRQVVHHLMAGLTTPQIAVEQGIALETVRGYVRDIRERLHCPRRSKTWVIVHFALVSAQAEPPTTDRPAPTLDAKQTLLLRAVAEHSTTRDISRAARIAPDDLRSALDVLHAATSTTDVTELVVRAHAWGLLPSRRIDVKGRSEQ
ncbi:LuxR C-terminal-related transcriptional regulator [Streptomyces sp. NPDC013181]|uniref:LuxR C-terminal-related transcriptional regulator n=1 Tax=Streptomyces sp. NPDC013181 TaxID=3364864 RepID=UPI00368E5630